MILLALSTSTPRGSVALLDGERQLAASAYVDLRGHAERLFGAIDEVLAAAGVPRAAIAALGCDVGPGSFTGVRVAVASAKGIALALGSQARLVGVTSLEAMAAAAWAEGAAAPGHLVIPTLDAKKDEVFLAAFDAPLASPCVPPQHLPRGAAWDAITRFAAARRVVVVGEVAEQIAELRPHLARGPALDLPDAVWVGRVAAARLRASADVGRESAFAAPSGEHDAALLEPLYVRAPDAKPAER